MLENPNAIANVVSNVDLSCFDQRWVLGAQIGRDTSSNFALSFDGLAVRTQDNRFVVPKLDGGVVRLTDVTCLTIAGDPYVFRVPVHIDDVEPGHLLVRSDSPLSLLYVEKSTRDRIQGIDPRTDQAVEIVVPDRSLDMPQLLVRIVGLFDTADGGLFGEDGGGGFGASDTGPGGGGGWTDMLWPLMFAGGFGGLTSTGSNNPALLAFALSRSQRFDSRLALLLLASGNQTSSLAQLLLLSALSGRRGSFFRGRQGQAQSPARPVPPRPAPPAQGAQSGPEPQSGPEKKS